MGILAPGVGHAALGDDGSEVRIRQHIHPRRRRHLPVRGRDDVLAPIGGESAEPVEEDQIAARRLGRGRRSFGAAGSGRLEARQPGAHFHQAAPVDLFRQRSPPVADDDARDRLEQNAVLVRYLLRPPHEDAARPIHHVGFDARGDQPHDLVLQQLPVTGAIFVPDHQVHRQSLQAPVGVGLHELAHQIDIRQVADLQQHDRQIAGNGIAPQAGLPAAVLAENGCVGAQRGIGVDDGAGKASIELRVGLGGIDLPQHHLAVRPRQVEDAIREMPVLVFPDQAQGCVAGFADAGDHVDRRRLFRIERDPIAGSRQSDPAPSPALPESAAESLIACGAATVRPRPMKRMRSVSYEISPTSAPCTAIR